MTTFLESFLGVLATSSMYSLSPVIWKDSVRARS